MDMSDPPSTIPFEDETKARTRNNEMHAWRPIFRGLRIIAVTNGALLGIGALSLTPLVAEVGPIEPEWLPAAAIGFVSLALLAASLTAFVLFCWSPPFEGESRATATLVTYALAVFVHLLGGVLYLQGEAGKVALLVLIGLAGQFVANLIFVSYLGMIARHFRLFSFHRATDVFIRVAIVAFVLWVTAGLLFPYKAEALGALLVIGVYTAVGWMLALVLLLHRKLNDSVRMPLAKAISSEQGVRRRWRVPRKPRSARWRRGERERKQQWDFLGPEADGHTSSSSGGVDFDSDD